jgi:hypothetical protein
MKRHFFAFAQHFPPWEAGHSMPCFFLVCLAWPRQRHHQLGKIMPALPAEQDPPPQPPAAAAHPHPSVGVCSSLH